ncbi:major paralogous domain-containing protein [Fibrobacter sp. UWOV1]|uniref:FISUMP domain-containing protein n=1 Tax=Fibrobacter sp. UWOV1 TaxID=1896215 RepID=UPI000919FA8F|nr:FISUMP domain-containing protein [Fibrobacter sp. UWOV1]SHL57802.1 major paralogous domain-containing protein [Fibrobacter sp. UWOV1]
MNYSKMAMQFVCKMAMPLALMFAACSTDEGNAISKVETTPGTQMGGSSEEPNVIAYENISLRGRAYYAPAGNEAGSSEYVSVSVPTNVFFDGGRIILTELDTVTLEPLDDSTITESFKGDVIDPLTGERVPGDDGMASFDSVSLRSPIVLLEAVSGEVSLSAIVDIRDANTFVIDGLSHLATYRIRKLAESGMSFVAAKARAETEIANALGFGSQNPFVEESLMNSSNVAVWRKAFNELVPFNLLQHLKEELGESGLLADLSEDTKKSLTEAVEKSHYWRLLSTSRKAFEMWDEDFYQECMQFKAYYVNLLASVFGVGQCSSENEGTFADVQGDLFELKCVSGSWEFAYRKTSRLNIAHTFGTMVDSRDGEEYKTVTIDLGGTSQTWMAENLRYAAEYSSCFRDDSSYCSVYGRLYSPLYGLDSSYRKYTTKESCVDVKTLEYLNGISSDDTLYWRGRAEEDCDELYEYGDYRDDGDNMLWDKVIDSLETINFEVCPEGWRMPKYEDWNALLSYLDGLGQGPALTLLLANYGNPTGFGLDLLADIRGEKGNYRAIVRGVGMYQFEPVVTPEEIRENAAGDVVGALATQTSSRRNGANMYFEALVLGYDLPGYGFVRCIKDE